MNTGIKAIGVGDALILVDIQNDFLPGGALPVPDGDRVVPVVNGYLERFKQQALPIFATRDWHPENHCSFEPQGGRWPPHCVAGSDGARFASGLELPDNLVVISKAEEQAVDAYSGFQGTELGAQLSELGVGRVFVAGLATDYCVLNTVMDALEEGLEVVLLEDAVRAVDVAPGDGERAIRSMHEGGAVSLRSDELES